MQRQFGDFVYLTFDVVGTLIDFEAGLIGCLAEIAAAAHRPFDAEEALTLYRAARYEPGADRFPDDLARVYLRIAPRLGLPTDPELGQRLRLSVHHWAAFPDSVDALSRLGRRFRLVAMTNAQRWAFEGFARTLGHPFHASFTVDDSGTEKPDPAFFEHVFDFIRSEGHRPADILHVAQSQYHDIGVSRRLGLTNCWIERRHAQPGYGGTIEPETFTEPDFHFTTLASLADAVERQEAG